MFGGNSEEKLIKMVTKKKWDALRKLMGKDKETVLHLAKACAHSSEDESTNILIELLRANDRDIQMAAIVSLSEVGNEHAVASLQYIEKSNPNCGDDMIKAIHTAISNIRNQNKDSLDHE